MASRMSKRLQKEFESIKKNFPEMDVQLPHNDLTLWRIRFRGAAGTLYEDEPLALQLRFSAEYVLAWTQPIEAPEVIFVEAVPIHEHIYSNGYICLSILYNVCLSILSMLSSSTKKVKPPNDAEFVKRAAGRSPKSFMWSFDDDKV